MTLFEYLAIAFSLVFSFSGMRLVAGLPHAVQPGRRYWVHVCLVAWQLLVTVNIFWAFWSFRDVTWNWSIFVLTLGSPGLIYFNACTLIPENASSVESWRDYFYSIRRRYFMGVSCWILAVSAISTFALAQPWFHPARGGQAAILVASVLGTLSENPRVLAGVAVLLLMISVLINVTFGLQPGSFSPP